MGVVESGWGGAFIRENGQTARGLPEGKFEIWSSQKSLVFIL